MAQNKLDDIILKKTNKILNAYEGNENSSDYEQFQSFEEFCARLLDSTNKKEKETLIYGESKEFTYLFTDLVVKNHEKNTLEKPYKMLAQEFLVDRAENTEEIINELDTNVIELSQVLKSSKKYGNEMRIQSEERAKQKQQEKIRSKESTELTNQVNQQELGELFENTNLKGLENRITTKQINLMHESLIQNKHPELHRTFGNMTRESNDFLNIVDIKNSFEKENINDFFELIHHNNPELYRSLSIMSESHVKSQNEFSNLNNKMKEAMKARGIQTEDEVPEHKGDREVFLESLHQHNGSPDVNYKATIDEVDYDIPSDLKENINHRNSPRPEPSFNNYDRNKRKRTM